MYHQFYEGMDLTHLPLFALFFFLAVFLGVVAWVFLARKSEDFDRSAQLPLTEQQASPRASGGTGYE